MFKPISFNDNNPKLLKKFPDEFKSFEDYYASRQPLLIEIQKFDKISLKKQMVYYVNSSGQKGNLFPRVHGFIAIGSRGNKNLSGKANIYSYKVFNVDIPIVNPTNGEDRTTRSLISATWSSETGIAKNDRILFESGKHLSSKMYPDIDPLTVMEIFRQQDLGTRYLLQKLFLDKYSPRYTPKHSGILEYMERLNKLIYFCSFPDASNPQSANCNKFCATLLQEAENVSAKKQGRKQKKVTSSSLFAIGANQRMFFWNPLAINERAMEQNDKAANSRRKQTGKMKF